MTSTKFFMYILYYIQYIYLHQWHILLSMCNYAYSQSLRVYIIYIRVTIKNWIFGIPINIILLIILINNLIKIMISCEQIWGKKFIFFTLYCTLQQKLNFQHYAKKKKKYNRNIFILYFRYYLKNINPNNVYLKAIYITYTIYLDNNVIY